MLKDRVEELNELLKFIVERQEHFECDAYWKFFDANLSDTKIGAILDKMNSNTY